MITTFKVIGRITSTGRRRNTRAGEFATRVEAEAKETEIEKTSMNATVIIEEVASI